MKTIKFEEKLIPLILSGEKTCTWRLFDDKDFKMGDDFICINKKSGEEFAKAKIVLIKEKILSEITEDDFVGHEKFESKEKMFEMYQKYYGEKVSWNDLVKMIEFKIL
jgi:hypothetical protein